MRERKETREKSRLPPNTLDKCEDACIDNYGNYERAYRIFHGVSHLISAPKLLQTTPMAMLEINMATVNCTKVSRSMA